MSVSGSPSFIPLSLLWNHWSIIDALEGGRPYHNEDAVYGATMVYDCTSNWGSLPHVEKDVSEEDKVSKMPEMSEVFPSVCGLDAYHRTIIIRII